MAIQREQGDLRKVVFVCLQYVRWPGTIPARRVTSQMAITMDWTATILAAAATQPANGYPLDGIDLRLSLPSAAPIRERTFFWRIRTAGRRS
jgi:arylsulfatase A-like enzyme